MRDTDLKLQAISDSLLTMVTNWAELPSLCQRMMSYSQRMMTLLAFLVMRKWMECMSMRNRSSVSLLSSVALSNMSCPFQLGVERGGTIPFRREANYNSCKFLLLNYFAIIKNHLFL